MCSAQYTQVVAASVLFFASSISFSYLSYESAFLCQIQTSNDPSTYIWKIYIYIHACQHFFYIKLFLERHTYLEDILPNYQDQIKKKKKSKKINLYNKRTDRIWLRMEKIIGHVYDNYLSCPIVPTCSSPAVTNFQPLSLWTPHPSPNPIQPISASPPFHAGSHPWLQSPTS